MFAFAFVAAPYSCEWGLSAYFWSGLACLAGTLALPVVLHGDLPAARRAGVASVLGGLAIVAWIAGLFAANVRIFCRLF